MTVPFAFGEQQMRDGHRTIMPGSLADVLAEEVKRLPSLKYQDQSQFTTDQSIADAYPDMVAAGFDPVSQYEEGKQAMVGGGEPDGDEILSRPSAGGFQFAPPDAMPMGPAQRRRRGY